VRCEKGSSHSPLEAPNVTVAVQVLQRFIREMSESPIRPVPARSRRRTN
jgi:hypothetical protein